MNYENFISTIIGGFIAGLVGIWTERYRMGQEAKKKHFEDLKNICLKGYIKNKLSYLSDDFNLVTM